MKIIPLAYKNENTYFIYLFKKINHYKSQGRETSKFNLISRILFLLNI